MLLIPWTILLLHDLRYLDRRCFSVMQVCLPAAFVVGRLLALFNTSEASRFAIVCAASPAVKPSKYCRRLLRLCQVHTFRCESENLARQALLPMPFVDFPLVALGPVESRSQALANSRQCLHWPSRLVRNDFFLLLFSFSTQRCRPRLRL
jgi:hypothetical protein